LLICPSRCCVAAGDATSSLRAKRLTRRAANLHPPLEGAARSAAEGAHRPRGRTAIPPGSIAIRHAVEHRAARPARVARVFHRDAARALADEHALPDGDRRSVADDHARMRRGEVRARAVALDDCVARKHPRRPSSQVTSTPALVQLCASAAPAEPAAIAATTTTANARTKMPPSTRGDLPSLHRRREADSGSAPQPMPTIVAARFL
jgi:hypothetical protein